MASTSDYDRAKGGKLKLKGNRSLFKADKSKKKRKVVQEIAKAIDPDIASHGGWRRISEECDLKGGINISLETADGSNCYLAAVDNGRFTIGGPHASGERPNPEEILTLIKTPDDPNISLKTGYGKYVGVDAEGSLVAVADAIGTRERLYVVFQDNKTAVQAVSSNLFLSMKPDQEGYIHVVSRTAGESEMINLRTDATPEGPVDWRSADDKKSARECETAFMKMYQHSKVITKGKQISINLNEKQAIRRAQNEGNLHELLLDRRTKMKSDKYC
ncbi:Protein FRG1 -like protein [Toxocara canis]|uniref:Protein FRG1-like protein n=2 Tax=Toxocara canis TaxID=6265 RepID=A0A0B2UPN2_TOXCA|nr:Protein FRG1 -like protein [Toxocara canis]VDM45073.1 unnamed protein product [Toxocara canis]